VAQGTAHELKAQIPGGRIDLTFPDAGTRLAAAGALGQELPDIDGLMLQIPTDGNVATLRRLLRELDDADVEVVDLSVHTPDLDDVFFALTGRHEPAEEEEPVR
jgi:ABC-2 type transport system ATP-binding protein